MKINVRNRDKKR